MTIVYTYLHPSHNMNGTHPKDPTTNKEPAVTAIKGSRYRRNIKTSRSRRMSLPTPRGDRREKKRTYIYRGLPVGGAYLLESSLTLLALS